MTDKLAAEPPRDEGGAGSDDQQQVAGSSDRFVTSRHTQLPIYVSQMPFNGLKG